MDHELPDVQARFRKFRGTRDQISNIRWISKKGREFQRNIYFCFIDYAKAFDCVDHNKLWKILKEIGIREYLTCLLRNLYARSIVKKQQLTGHVKADWFQIRKGICQCCILSLCLNNLYAEYIMICWAGWCTSWNQDCQEKYHNLRYADETTFMAESEEELKSLLMKWWKWKRRVKKLV